MGVHFHLRVKPATEVLGVLNTSNNIAANTNIVEVDFFQLLKNKCNSTADNASAGQSHQMLRLL
jgi:hypothetical protein